MSNKGIGKILLEILEASQSSHWETTYDEVLREVAARVASQGYIGKADIGALVVWKRPTATAPLVQTTHEHAGGKGPRRHCTGVRPRE